MRLTLAQIADTKRYVLFLGASNGAGGSSEIADIAGAAVAHNAKAVQYCATHDSIWINMHDQAANVRAVALGIKRFKVGDIPGTIEEFLPPSEIS